MKLLIDEDSQGDLVIRRLRDTGHDVLTVNEAGLASEADDVVFALARSERRVLLTRNVDDFEALHDAEADHAGILAEYQNQNRGKNMTAADIARAIANLEASGWDITGQFVPLNAWSYGGQENAP